MELYHQLGVMKSRWQLKTNKFMTTLLKDLFENDKWHVKGDDPFGSTTIHIVIFLVMKGSHYNLHDALKVMVLTHEFFNTLLFNVLRFIGRSLRRPTTLKTSWIMESLWWWASWWHQWMLWPYEYGLNQMIPWNCS